MQDADYQRHFKVLGKLAYLYDTAASESTDILTLLTVFVDQYATGTLASAPAVALFPTYTRRWENAIADGADALKQIALDAGAAYLANDDFRDDLTTVPASPKTAATTLAALQTEMGAGVDNKTLGTLTTTGLVLFFNNILGSAGTWNTESDATADYRDAVYVVGTIV